MPIYFDERGVRLADAPGAVAEPATAETPSVPSEQTQEGESSAASKTEHMRMMDAVREAAREYDTPTEADIREFVAGRAKDPSKVDIQKFLELTLDQRQADLIDLLDNHLRQAGPMKRGRRKVRISAPRGYLRRLMRNMDSDSIAQVTLRLQSMGHDPEVVKELLTRKRGAQKTAEVDEKIAEMSETGNWTTDGIEFVEDSWEEHENPSEVMNVDPAEMAQRIASNLPQPVINVTVQAPKSGKKVVKRNPDTGLIESVEEEEDAS
jgi:hypothetical protein